MLCRSVDVRRAAELETSPRVVPYVRGTPHPIRACCAWQYPFRVLEGPAAPYSARVSSNPSSPSQLPFLPGMHRPPGFSLPFLLTDAFPLSSSHSCFPLMYLINVAMLPRAGHGTWSRGHTGDGRGEEPAPSQTWCSGRARPVGTEQCQAVEAVHRHGDRGSNPGRVALSISEGQPSSRDVRDEAAAEDWE